MVCVLCIVESPRSPRSCVHVKKFKEWCVFVHILRCARSHERITKHRHNMARVLMNYVFGLEP